jgi:hypothetical protein
VEAYEASLHKSSDQDPDLDLGDINGPKPSKQERREIEACLAIRTFLNNVPKGNFENAVAMLRRIIFGVFRAGPKPDLNPTAFEPHRRHSIHTSLDETMEH